MYLKSFVADVDLHVVNIWLESVFILIIFYFSNVKLNINFLSYISYESWPVCGGILVRSINSIFYNSVLSYIFSRSSIFTVILLILPSSTAWKVSVFGVILLRIFPHWDWMRWNSPYQINTSIKFQWEHSNWKSIGN